MFITGLMFVLLVCVERFCLRLCDRLIRLLIQGVWLRLDIILLGM